jgi:hypothetical protein
LQGFLDGSEPFNFEDDASPIQHARASVIQNTTTEPQIASTNASSDFSTLTGNHRETLPQAHGPGHRPSVDLSAGRMGSNSAFKRARMDLFRKPSHTTHVAHSPRSNGSHYRQGSNEEETTSGAHAPARVDEISDKSATANGSKISHSAQPSQNHNADHALASMTRPLHDTFTSPNRGTTNRQHTWATRNPHVPPTESSKMQPWKGGPSKSPETSAALSLQLRPTPVPVHNFYSTGTGQNDDESEYLINYEPIPARPRANDKDPLPALKEESKSTPGTSAQADVAKVSSTFGARRSYAPNNKKTEHAHVRDALDSTGRDQNDSKKNLGSDEHVHSNSKRSSHDSGTDANDKEREDGRNVKPRTDTLIAERGGEYVCVCLKNLQVATAKWHLTSMLQHIPQNRKPPMDRTDNRARQRVV